MEDRISLLPDCLLVEILSRLPETTYAIRTGALSKRWQRVWTQVNYLSFISTFPHSRFSLFVDKTLTQCSSQSNLNKFRLSTPPFTEFESKVNDWIIYATNRNVQELVLSIWYYLPEDDRFELLAQCFYMNSCFTHLQLEGCLLNPSGAISWNKLKSLYICSMELDENLIQNILSGSPLLETLELYFCDGFRRIDITSKSVKNLVFSGYYSLREFSVEISAPHIQSLTIQGCLRLCKFVLHDMSSLVKAKLIYFKAEGYYGNIYKDAAEMLKGLILSLYHVKELMIGKQCVQVLTRLEAKGFKFPSGMKLLDATSSYINDSDLL